ncbi:iron-containing alcohol dehydrogenase, partial [Lactobacillus paragasseri]
PPVECIQDGVEKFKASGADFLIGLGGGSPQDTCKGIGIIVANPEFGDVLSLEGVADTKNPSVPIFGVPTTAGTASETTINYVVTDTA